MLGVPQSQLYPDAKARVLAAHPKAKCAMQWSINKYAIILPDGRRIIGDGSPSSTWVTALFTLGLAT